MNLSYLQQPKYIPLAYLPNTKRSFEITKEIKVFLSDNREVVIPRGFITDLSSKPRFLWSLFPPFDSSLISTIIHDYLWSNKLKEIEYHGSIYKAFEFSNKEFFEWNKALKKNKFINYIEYYFLKYFSMPYYTNKKKIK